MSDNIYKSKRWQALKRSILKRDKYIDQLEIRKGKLKSAEVVHHIIPVSYSDLLKYECDNLISLSRASHNKLHNRNSDALSVEGFAFALSAWRKSQRLKNIITLEELKEAHKQALARVKC